MATVTKVAGKEIHSNHVSIQITRTSNVRGTSDVDVLILLHSCTMEDPIEVIHSLFVDDAGRQPSLGDRSKFEPSGGWTSDARCITMARLESDNQGTHND